MNKVYPYLNLQETPEDPTQCNILTLSHSKGSINLFNNDANFDWMYPEHLQMMSQKHWTPIAIAKKAAEYLAVPGGRILDVGSGIGKFCLTAAYYHPEVNFYGVEQRGELVEYANNCKEYTQLSNVNFVHANITQIDFKAFDHFYLYNSFYENIDQANRIDDTIATSYSLYAYYTQYLFLKLKSNLPGTRLVTYQCNASDVPPCYQLVNSSFDNLLQL